MQERDNILRIFKETRKAMNQGNASKIRDLSNQTTNTAALTKDPDNIAAAVVVYSLSKILERQGYENMPGWKKFYKIYTTAIEKIISSLEKKDDEAYRKNIELIEQAADKLSGQLRENIKAIFRKARINKASRIYEHGISMEQTARLLGVSMFDLANYVGQSSAYEFPGNTISEKERIKIAMEMFR